MEHPFLPSSKRRKPINVSPLLMPIYLPILILGAVATIPLTRLRRMKIERQERQFAKRMRDQGRLVNWKELAHQIESRQGTFIGEFLSIKGPVRFWWTPENIKEI